MKRTATIPQVVVVPFECEGSENEIYEGAARCKVYPGTRDSYSHTFDCWSPGDGPLVELLDVVIHSVTVTVQGLPKELKDTDGLEHEVKRVLEDSDKLTEDALDAAREQYEEMRYYEGD